MRSLFSGIFKGLLPQTHQQLRARNVGKVMKSFNNKANTQSDEEEDQIKSIQEEPKFDQKAFIYKKEQEQQQLKQQYEQQFKKVEEKIEKQQVDKSRQELLKETRDHYKKNESEEKQKSKYKKFEDLSNVKYYSEQELTRFIRQSKNGENLFRLYNAHKFTYTTKNLVHTLTKYTKLVSEDKKNKLPKYDRRIMTLIASLQSYTNMLSNAEKSMILWSLCRLNQQEEIVENIIKELVSVKQQLTFKQISILLWVMGKFSLKQTSQLNEICLEIALRLDDPLTKVDIVEKIQQDPKQKTEDEIEFEDLEEILELPESRENIIEPQSLSMSLWSIGKLGIYDEDLMKSALNVISNNIEKFEPLMITNILYSFSNIKFQNKEVFEEFSKSLKKDMKSLEKENMLTLKTLLISLCKLKIEDKELILNIANMILDKTNFKKNSMSPRFMSEIIYSLSKRYVYDSKIYNKMASNAINVVDQMNLRDCCETLYAFAKYLNQNKSLQTAIQVICTRIAQLEGKIDKKSKELIQNSIKIGNIKNKELNNIMKK